MPHAGGVRSKEKLRQEKEERERELRRLINLKREELRDQLKKVEEVAGSNVRRWLVEVH